MVAIKTALLLACLCFGPAIGKTVLTKAVSAAVAKDATGDTDIEPGVNDGVVDLPLATLSHKCVIGGGLTLTLKTQAATITRRAAIVVSALTTGSTQPDGADAFQDSICQTKFVIPEDATPADQAAQLTISPANGASCGRSAPDNVGTYTWKVTVAQFLTVGTLEREFQKPVTILCKTLKPADTDSDINADTVPVISAITQVDVNVPVVFLITRTPAVSNGKWTFTITPETLSALAGQNFRITRCTASTGSVVGGDGVRITNDLIKDSCIVDRGTAVNHADSPNNQIITVSVFRFVANPTGQVSLQCALELCNASGCSAISPCTTPPRNAIAATSNSRHQRSVSQVYLTVDN